MKPSGTSGRLAVVAFGGNALLRAGQRGTFEEQLANVVRTCENLVPLLKADGRLVITHGNGPQVGNGLLRHQAGESRYGLPAQPMDACGAETQGAIAYLIETALEQVLLRHGIRRQVVSLVTRVEVRADDPAFLHPTKPVGPYYPEKPAGGVYRQDPGGRGWRKLVPSPLPVDIGQADLAGRLAGEGYIVVAAGGGGIPVVRTPDGCKGVEAVIDKDLVSAFLAQRIGADELYILTDVPKVYARFRQPGETAIDCMTLERARAFLADGEAAEGSMAPKIRAGIQFIEHGGKTCIITEAGSLGDPACGTRIIR